MATEPILEIDSLLEPIPGDEPAGFAVPFNIRRQLDEFRKEVLPEQFSPDDPLRPDQPKAADWPGVIRVAQETLKESSKDMLVAARLTEALTREHAFAGLRDGLALMRRLVEECWDRVHPSIEDGDVEVRAAAFNWLDDPDRGARFPHTIRAAGFLPGEERKLSWRDWRDVMDGKETLTKEALDQATEQISREEIQNTVDDINEALGEIDKIVEILNEKMADVAPGMSEVRSSLRECLQLAEQILGKKEPPPAADEEAVPSDLGENLEELDVSSESDGSPGEGSGGGGRRRLSNRAEVYAQLEEVSRRLMEFDPHSPIAYLVQRAVKLSKLSLPQLLRVLIRNSDALMDLSRDLDLGVEEVESSGENEPTEEIT